MFTNKATLPSPLGSEPNVCSGAAASPAPSPSSRLRP